MKVLQIINNLGSGGAERLLSNYVIENKDRNNDVENDVLLFTEKNSVFSESIRRSNINVMTLNTKNIYCFINIFKLIKLLQKKKYDVIHTHLFPSQYFVVLAKILSRGNYKMTTTEHSTYNRRRNYIFFKKIDKYIYNQYDLIISISEDVQQQLIKWLDPSSLTKFEVLDNGVSINDFKNASPIDRKEIDNNITENDILLVMVARFTEVKDHETVLKSLAQLSLKYKLILVGEGEDLEKAQKLASKLNIEKRVFFLGFRDDVERILKTSNIMIMSSEWEGFGLAAVEGMAAGLPVIVSDVPGLNSVVDDSDLQFQFGNYDELTRKILMLEDKKIYESKVRYSNSQAKKFDISKYVTELNLKYKTL